ncbi:polyketide biosynthesis enoyl-CoA hydratase PksI [Crossiella equi]|uniref:Polyketide biosynthesis enoyl-CoA hydratase PksI n=1 Tax=Crossiella equi TaxID=130796 RepID=A0ABS5ATA0_9PSEU|nr:polyketide synthase [Crossiella equi]MBP2479454.1 polyketide biosynthesis enoyl-CoA hydratase PksI [Crossiella equi]
MEFGPITVEFHAPLATVRFADREHGNTFRREWLDNLFKAVDAAAEHPETRVVLAAGLPDIFCAGATKETLVGLADGLPLEEYRRFARVLATCPLPVVAAMQGHALGGGLVLGLYADAAVLSERSYYAANFMQYGVAPYVGATYVVPARIGEALGTEMLLTARGFRGRELAQRGCGVRVVPHEQVPQTATDLALTIARAPRESLRLLKSELSQKALAASDAAMARELPAHMASRENPQVAELARAGYGVLRGLGQS